MNRPLLVSIAQAAHLLSVGTSTIRRLIKQGNLESVKIRRRRLVTTESLLSFSGKGTDLALHKRVLAGPQGE